jgi:hypothetical protein
MDTKHNFLVQYMHKDRNQRGHGELLLKPTEKRAENTNCGSILNNCTFGLYIEQR